MGRIFGRLLKLWYLADFILAVGEAYTIIPIYSVVLLILHDVFCTPFATEEGPFGAKTFC